MLARRFTIVCLLIAIFGMSLAIFVAEESRPARAHGTSPFACDPARALSCPRPALR